MLKKKFVSSLVAVTMILAPSMMVRAGDDTEQFEIGKKYSNTVEADSEIDYPIKVNKDTVIKATDNSEDVYVGIFIPDTGDYYYLDEDEPFNMKAGVDYEIQVYNSGESAVDHEFTIVNPKNVVVQDIKYQRIKPGDKREFKVISTYPEGTKMGFEWYDEDDNLLSDQTDIV